MVSHFPDFCQAGLSEAGIYTTENRKKVLNRFWGSIRRYVYTLILYP